MTQTVMPNFHRAPALLAGALAAFAAWSAPASAQDKVFPPGQEKPLPGTTTVTDETLTSVVVQVSGGGKTTYQWVDGPRVIYGEGDAPFAKALSAMGGGDYAAAIAILEPLDVKREIFKPRRLYLLGLCYESSGDLKAAEKKFQELAEKYENNFWTADGIRALVEVQIKNKNFKGAVDAADKGIAIAQKLKADAVGFRFRIYKAGAFEAQDDFKNAEAEFRAVASGATGSKEGAIAGKLANIGLARLAARQGDAAKAKTIIEPLLKETESVILAPAYAAMGEALLAQGVGEKNVERIREAAIDNFLRVIAYCPPGQSESQDPLEWAMYGYIRAAKRITELEKNKTDLEFWNQEGLKYCKEFRERFRNSRLTSKVSEIQKEFKPGPG